MKENRRLLPEGKLLVFFCIVALFGFASGMSDNVISNFFKDAYNVDARERGFLEFPREIPGVLCFLIVAFTSSIGDVRLSMIAQVLCAIGSIVLGFFTPAFGIMALFIFIHSLGAHIYFPLQDSIGMSIVGEHEVGKRMGQYASIRSAFAMVASILIFIGFRAGFFSFVTQIKLPFIIGGFTYFIVLALFILLYIRHKVKGEARKKKFQIVIKKEYKFYYALAVLTSVHRQVMMVFGPWVLIELLIQGPDTLALLGIVSSLLAVFFLPIIGRLVDRIGTKKILLAEGIAFIFVYLLYGYMSSGFENGTISKIGFPVIVMFCLYVFDRLTMSLNLVRTAYLRSIVTDLADITPTISTGFSMDHVISIICAYMGGVAWLRFGSQYVFYGAAIISVLNVIIAILIKQPKKTAAAA